ncbi:short chain enoyl-CoA hydratase [Caballeronia choica]|uniref:Short chain enoyl-CoA hydratase n=1 Tax=Caballeronia choica TaxID=326476 RepID=A0A158KFQ9_9BURK|nr:enoyl-CoA hydratase/isomerase family protein [Caballeronia choica]SAL79845.1 short chain enoyl-CoA hydratase [Caballeronia choica]
MNYPEFTTLRVDVAAGVARLTIDHGPINLMDGAMLADLDRASRLLEDDQAVKVVILQSANPDFFIAHGDVSAIQQLPSKPAPREQKLGDLHAILDRFRTMPKATIAKIEGRCRGGGSELALACDMRFAAIGRAFLCQPEVGVGIIPGAGGSARLPRMVGRGRALEIILGCADFNAETAERYGWVNRAVPAAEIGYFVNALAARIAGFPAAALALAKQMVDATDGTIEADLALEERLFLQSAQTSGARTRIAAAMGAGMQTRGMEMCCFTHVWAPMAGLE